MANEYQLRRIPEILHTQWKIIAAARNLSMRELALIALMHEIDKDKGDDTDVGRLEELDN